MKISVFGLGYVGTVASACMAESGHDVIAIDTDFIKVKCIQDSRAPIIEPGLTEIIEKNVKNGRLKAVSDCKTAVMNSDISLICVGTPSNEDGSLKLDYVESACRDIGEALKDKDGYHIVVLRSTVVPGTAKNVAIPAIEKASGKKAGVDFGFGSNPEFLRESSAIYDYYHPPKIVIGASDARTASAISDIYKGIEAPEVVVPIDVSEGVKYADNAWHAMKVGFANEIGNIFKEHDVDSHKVMDVFFLDTKLNISKAYLKPGFAFGGSCLPKDVRAIRASAKSKGLKTPIFDSLLEANDAQIERAHDLIRENGSKNVGLLGLSFKAGTDDLRESPLVTLANLLLKDGLQLSIYDPSVYEAAGMEGANKKYIHENIPHIYSCMVKTPDELLSRSDIFVIGNHGEDYNLILERANDNSHVIDLVRLKDGGGLETRKSYTGICW